VKKTNYVKISKYGEDIYQGDRDMGARLRVFLTRKQDEMLLKLRTVKGRQRRGRVPRLEATVVGSTDLKQLAWSFGNEPERATKENKTRKLEKLSKQT
jgi:hypothetical protein